MDLFDPITKDSPIEVLPMDGSVQYHGVVIEPAAADVFLQKLLEEIAWQNDQAIIFGKKITTKRKVAWYSDHPYSYTYSNTTRTALLWTPLLLELKNIAQTETGETYNSCLLNLYHDGSEGVGWHSDGEKELKENGAIASFSFGAERKFSFKHKQSKQRLSLVLDHGSLLVMKGTTQKHWLHSLPTTKSTDKPRVNLTFRTIESSSSVH